MAKNDDYPTFATKAKVPSAPLEMIPYITTLLDAFKERADKWINRKPKGTKEVYSTYVALRRLWEVTDALNKMVEKACNRIELDHLVPKFEEIGQSSTNLPELGVRLQVRYDLYAGIRATKPAVGDAKPEKLTADEKAAVKAKAFEWLRRNGMGALIQPQVHYQSLAADMRVWIAEKNKQPPEDLFSVYNKPVVSMVKTAKD